MLRIAVLPVPTPRNVRPGAKRLTVAIAFAVAGATRNPGIATPEPTRILSVRSATNAIITHRFDRNRGLSHTQQKSYPWSSAWTAKSISSNRLTVTPNFMKKTSNRWFSLNEKPELHGVLLSPRTYGTPEALQPEPRIDDRVLRLR